MTDVGYHDRATNNVIGAVLREIREDARLSLGEVESRSRGAHKGNKIASWERGERTPTVSDCIDLCNVLKVSPAHFLEVVERRMQMAKAG